MIEIVSGSLGSGKSTYAAWSARFHTKRPGWVIAANYSPPKDWIPRSKGCWITTSVPDDLYNAIEHIQEIRSGVNDYPGLLILDDCHSIFNSRQWQKNSDWIEFLSNSRKLGFHVLLITHSDTMIDKQIRNFVEYQTHFRSLRRIFIPYCPIDIPIWPWPLPEQFFYAQRYYGNGLGKGEIAKRGLFGLSSVLPYSTGTVFRVSGIAGEIKTYSEVSGTIFQRFFRRVSGILQRLSSDRQGVVRARIFGVRPACPTALSRRLFVRGICIGCPSACLPFNAPVR